MISFIIALLLLSGAVISTLVAAQSVCDVIKGSNSHDR